MEQQAALAMPHDRCSSTALNAESVNPCLVFLHTFISLGYTPECIVCGFPVAYYAHDTRRSANGSAYITASCRRQAPFMVFLCFDPRRPISIAHLHRLRDVCYEWPAVS